MNTSTKISSDMLFVPSQDDVK